MSKLKKEMILILIILISSVSFAELQPGKLWINGVFIPYSLEKEIELEKPAIEPKQISYVYANGQRIAKVENNEVYYFHNDHLGSPRVITDTNGNVVEKIDYLPFGESFNGDEKVGYNSKELDKDTKLNYYGARYYNSEVGRFITADIVKGNLIDPQSLNLYVYVKNNPMKYVDPNGEKVRLFGKEKYKKRILTELNTMFGEEIIGRDNEGFLNIKEKNYDKESDFEKYHLYTLLKSRISGERITSETRILGELDISSHKGAQDSITININQIDEIVPFGKGGSLISLGTISTIFIHELTHTWSKFFGEYDYELYEKGYFEDHSSQEVGAVKYENYARRLLKIPERIYYTSFNIKDEEGNLRTGLTLPETYDWYSLSRFRTDLKMFRLQDKPDLVIPHFINIK